jgi:large subunit ribosomal protein L22
MSQNETAKKVQSKAILRGAKVTPRKARLVIDLIRGQSVEKAVGILNYTPRKASPLIKRLLDSAAANMKNLFQIEKNLFVEQCWVNEGLRMKRMMPRAKGQGDRYVKRTCHITIILGVKE